VIAKARILLSEFASGHSDRARAQRDAAAAFGLRVASAALLYLTQVVMAR